MRISQQGLEALALDGGTPVRRTLLPYGRHEITDRDIDAVVEVLRSDWLTTGPRVEEFEERFAVVAGASHAVAVSSGTVGLHLAVAAAGIGQGDEIVTSPLTFCASANCALYQGATPVFADIRPDTLNLDLHDVERRLSPRTRALIPVDYAGHPADLEAFRALADRQGLFVIEDACHALGASLDGRAIGSISHMTVFSLHPVKHVTTGEGGVITTEDPDLARTLRSLRNHGLDTTARARQAEGRWSYDMTRLGFNYRLSDVGCALGSSQLSRLPGNLARRREIAEQYSQALGSVDGLRLPVVLAGVEHAWHFYPVRLDLDRVPCGRARVFHALRAEGVGVNVHYPPVHLHSFYRRQFGYQGGEYPIAEASYESLLTLPLFHSMAPQDTRDVIDAVEKVMVHSVV